MQGCAWRGAFCRPGKQSCLDSPCVGCQGAWPEDASAISSSCLRPNPNCAVARLRAPGRMRCSLFLVRRCPSRWRPSSVAGVWRRGRKWVPHIESRGTRALRSLRGRALGRFNINLYKSVSPLTCLGLLGPPTCSRTVMKRSNQCNCFAYKYLYFIKPRIVLSSFFFLNHTYKKDVDNS